MRAVLFGARKKPCYHDRSLPWVLTVMPEAAGLAEGVVPVNIGMVERAAEAVKAVLSHEFCEQCLLMEKFCRFCLVMQLRCRAGRLVRAVLKEAGNAPMRDPEGLVCIVLKSLNHGRLVQDARELAHEGPCKEVRDSGCMCAVCLWPEDTWPPYYRADCCPCGWARAMCRLKIVLAPGKDS